MKKITFLALFCFTALGTYAQNFYNFSTLQAEYTNLENSTSINNGEVWDYDFFGTIAIPFDFSFAGEPVNRFVFDDDYFGFVTPTGDYEQGTGAFYVYSSAALIQDRTYNTGVSSSPISYKVEGTAGSRILKIEVKNAGLEEAETLGFSADHFYINTQIWLYESDNSMEFRYGDHNITDFSYITNDSESLLGGMEDSNEKAYLIYGQSINPTYSEFTPGNLPEGEFESDSFPASGTVYRFTPASVADLKDFSASTVKIYPNPASSVLNLKSDNAILSEYAIYNVLGKMIVQNKVNETNNIQINVDGLERGIYFVKVNTQYLKFIKN